MKAVRIHDYGQAPVYEDAPMPELRDDEVLVEVMAVSLNRIDIKTAGGEYKDKSPLEFPWTPGVDFAGRIDYIGDNIEGLAKGDQVYGKVTEGSLADYIAVKKESIAGMPSNISFAEAASTAHTGLTAWEAVFEHGKIEPGQNVLILGAAGAVGSFAVQFVKLAGGYIYAVAAGDDIPYLESIGADVIIDYTHADFSTIVKDVDLVLDFVGGESLAKSYAVVNKGGRIVTTAGTPDEAQNKKHLIKAIAMGVHPDSGALSEITQLIEAGKVRADVAQVYPISEIQKGWEVYSGKSKSEKQYTHGKIVVEFQ